MSKYIEIVFLEDDKYHDMVDQVGDNLVAIVEYMAQWDYGDNDNVIDVTGVRDNIYEDIIAGYSLVVNRNCAYATLLREIKD